MYYFMIDDEPKCFGSKENKNRINKKALNMDKYWCQSHYKTDQLLVQNFVISRLYTHKSRTCKLLLTSLKLTY
jgi:hypothetical protein